MVTDLPDYTRLVTINVLVPPSEQAPVIPRPKGPLLSKNSLTTSNAYQTLLTYTPTKGKSLQISKLVISAETATYFKIRWDGTDLTSERLMDDRTLVLEHFPWDSYDIDGNGLKVMDVQVKRYSTNGIASGEIYGEEVDTT